MDNPHVMSKYATELDCLKARDKWFQEQLAAVNEENEALRVELLTPKVFTRLLNWLREDPPRSASAAFTAGIERQIAYALEMDVLPEVKSLRLKLAHTERSLELAKELAIERKKIIEELESSK